jgi:hypothetical protein
MSNNPLDRIPSFDRVSVRAVVVREGEDPGPLLAAAGIVDPVAVPVVFGEAAPGRSFGDGFTPNVPAVVEFDQEAGGFAGGGDEQEDGGEDIGAVASETASGHGRSDAGAAPRSGPGTMMLPAAFGLQPMAPVRRAGDTGQPANRASALPSVFAAGTTEPRDPAGDISGDTAGGASRPSSDGQ